MIFKIQGSMCIFYEIYDVLLFLLLILSFHKNLKLINFKLKLNHKKK